MLTHEALTTQALTPQRLQQISDARQHKKLAVAKLVSLFENRLKESAQERHDIICHLQNEAPPRGSIIGFTGTPGAGKSTLIAELCKTLLAKDTQVSVAVLAIDPSSHISGGSILGDRTRMRITENAERLYFRSQASNLELGGITQATYHATRILRYFYDFIFIETVGIGQNEIDIQHMAHHTFLVMQPLAGDQIQFMKCGIMEIPDSFVINKCDEDRLAKSSYYMLRTALKHARLVEASATDDVKQAHKENIFMISALKQIGLEPLAEKILTLRDQGKHRSDDRFYLNKLIAKQYGEFGLQIIARVDDHDEALLPTFEAKQRAAEAAVRAQIKLV
ncbi:LAO/AO transport system kinase [gamma proteobacterium HdN1]|nr:LAO/AO transport system kinase [gamma proteobacterium HdN1]